ncbi:MAG: phosphocholine cytidylyltransferase family protein [Pseudomonadota bacterium]
MTARAIILAAGKSKRLGALTAGMPKCLLPLGRATILDHQIINLHRSGIKDITLVTGFCDALIREHCGSSVRYILNAEYDTTNSLYSLWLALKQERGSIIVLNSDVVFHPDILAKLIASPHPEALTISFQAGMGQEEMKVTVREGKICDIRKDMDPAKADGENVGVVKFSQEGSRALFEKADALVASGTVKAWAPLAFQKLCSEVDLYAVSTEGLPWIEIDFPEDFAKAQTLVYPAICKSL